VFYSRIRIHVAVTTILSPIQDTYANGDKGYKWIQNTTCIRATCIRCKRGIIRAPRVVTERRVLNYKHFDVNNETMMQYCMTVWPPCDLRHLWAIHKDRARTFYNIPFWLISESLALSGFKSADRRAQGNVMRLSTRPITWDVSVVMYSGHKQRTPAFSISLNRIQNQTNMTNTLPSCR